MTIKSKDSVELFGVNVNDKLTFEKHIKKLCRSASCQLNTMLRLKNVLNFHAKKKKKNHRKFRIFKPRLLLNIVALLHYKKSFKKSKVIIKNRKY